MNLLSVEDKIQLLKNLLSDPDDWVSREILRLNESDEKERSAASELIAPTSES